MPIVYYIKYSHCTCSKGVKQPIRRTAENSFSRIPGSSIKWLHLVKWERMEKDMMEVIGHSFKNVNALVCISNRK